MSWSTIVLPAGADPWATPYGFALDHIWACPETNAARRAHWPEGTWVVVMPCRDLDPPTELTEGATRWVFFESGQEYEPTADDLAAPDWQIAELEDQP